MFQSELAPAPLSARNGHIRDMSLCDFLRPINSENLLGNI